MTIDAYRFGRITIDGQDYDHDVIVFPQRVHANWWRQQGHRLEVADLEEVFRDPPQVLVIGTGYFGNMTVPEATLAVLRARGIETRVLRTGEAVTELDRLQRELARVVAALHLTC